MTGGGGGDEGGAFGGDRGVTTGGDWEACYSHLCHKAYRTKIFVVPLMKLPSL